jgi:hypothetical protein
LSEVMSQEERLMVVTMPLALALSITYELVEVVTVMAAATVPHSERRVTRGENMMGNQQNDVEVDVQIELDSACRCSWYGTLMQKKKKKKVKHEHRTVSTGRTLKGRTMSPN